MKILLIENKAALVAKIRAAVVRENFTMDVAVSGAEGYFLGWSERYDAVVLDLALPLKAGITILRKWRAEGRTTPVLILTGRTRWRDRVDGLIAGADDYLAKPFRTEELVAQLRALVRRATDPTVTELTFGGLSVNRETGQVQQGGRCVEVTGIERKLLTAMMTNPDRVHRNFELHEKLYGDKEEQVAGPLELYMTRLRGKLEPGFIQPVRGQGYRLRNSAGPDL